MQPAQTQVVTTDFSLGYLLTMAAQWGLKLIAFAAILVIGTIVARWLGTMLDRVLERVGFDRAVERGGIKQALSRGGYDASSLLGKLLFYGLMLFVLHFAFAVFGPNPISDMIASVIAFIPNVLVAVAIMVVAASIASMVRDLIRGSIGGLSYGPYLATAASVAILTIGGFAALTQLNIAEPIVLGVFYAALAIIVGVAIVGVGGGLIKPMEDRWRGVFSRAEMELPRVQAELKGQPAGMAYPGQVYPGRMEPSPRPGD